MPPKRRHQYDFVVIGAGIAGMTAACNAASHGLSCVLVEGGGLFGGQVATVTMVEGFVPEAAPSGADIAAALLASIRASGIDVVESVAEAVEVEGRDYRIRLAGGRFLQTRAVVVASGARLRELNATGAAKYLGRGISSCASCDGPFFRSKDVVVLGGGDSALQEASVLAPICKSVSLVVRGRLKARHCYIKRLQKYANVNFIWDCVVDEVMGDDTALTGVRLRNLENGAVREIHCHGLFPYLGTRPNSAFLANMLELDEAGCVKTDARFETSRAGIYAVGAVRSNYSGELSSAAGEGAAIAKIVAASLN